MLVRCELATERSALNPALLLKNLVAFGKQLHTSHSLSKYLLSTCSVPGCSCQGYSSDQ